jgi:predicted transcriptional regulator
MKNKATKELVLQLYKMRQAGYTFKEISHKMGMPVGTVATWCAKMIKLGLNPFVEKRDSFKKIVNQIKNELKIK